MTTPQHFHAIAWLDHRDAKIFHFNADDSQLTHVRSHHPDLHIHHKANTRDDGHAPVDKEFLERIVKGFGGAGAILITGPANAKTELVSYIEQAHPDVGRRIAAVETLDHPTDGQIVAHGRKFFKADDRMQAQSALER